MDCRASALGIEVKSYPEDRKLLVEEAYKDMKSENQSAMKNREWASSTIRDLYPLVESIRLVAAEKTDFLFFPEVEKLIECCEALPQKAFTICNSATNLLLDGLKAHELALIYFRNNQPESALRELNKINEFANRFCCIYETVEKEISASIDLCDQAMCAVAGRHGFLRSEIMSLQLQLVNTAEENTQPINIEIFNELLMLESRLNIVVRFDDRTIKSFGRILPCLNNLGIDVLDLSRDIGNFRGNLDFMKLYLEDTDEKEFFPCWRSSYLDWRCVADINKIMVAAFKKD